MRILLISELESDQNLIERLLDGIADIPSELITCPADPHALAARDLGRIHLMLWGAISDVQIAARLLMEMSRQHLALPVVVLTDKHLPDHTTSERHHNPPRDFEVLSRQTLSVPLMRSALLHFGARRQSGSQAPARVPDPLTGLSNRQHLREQLATLLDDKTGSDSVALLLIDVDQFKKVNVSYGQGAGDALIQLIAERIQSCLAPGQRLARIGGNEFAVIFQSPTDLESEARLRTDAILQAMAKPFPLARHAVKMHASLGLAIKDATMMTVDALFAHADMAMRAAKQDKGNTCRLYTREMTDAAQKELKLESEIRRSLRKEDFVLHFQPRIDIARNRVVGVEALLRWQHPVRGLLSPAAFISVAEDSGLIVPLGYWIIHAACKHLNELSARGYDHIQIAVNVAFKQFQDSNFVRTVANIIRKHDISPGRLEFELTETTMMIEGSAVDQSLRQLSDLGIAISLDDFGTGYSSFAHIQRLPISALKIDRSFVSSVNKSVNDATIVKAIINLAHSLNMEVIAEGAETIDQVDFLREHKCDQVQGYYFSRPVSYDDFLVLLQLERERGFDSLWSKVKV